MTRIPPPQLSANLSVALPPLPPPFTGRWGGGLLKWAACVFGGGLKREIRRSAQNYLVTSTDAMIGISDLFQKDLEEGLIHITYGAGQAMNATLFNWDLRIFSFLDIL